MVRDTKVEFDTAHAAHCTDVVGFGLGCGCWEAFDE